MRLKEATGNSLSRDRSGMVDIVICLYLRKISSLTALGPVCILASCIMRPELPGSLFPTYFRDDEYWLWTGTLGCWPPLNVTGDPCHLEHPVCSQDWLCCAQLCGTSILPFPTILKTGRLWLPYPNASSLTRPVVLTANCPVHGVWFNLSFPYTSKPSRVKENPLPE